MKFVASRLKTKRAAQHFDELSGEIAAYMATSPLRLTWEAISWSARFDAIYPPNSQLVGLISRIQVPVPDKLAPIVGDVVHNLRSALDIMMTEIILGFDPTASAVERQLCFPMWESAADKKKALRKSNVSRADPMVAKLVEAWEPFRGGRSRLFTLHELWNLDKHRSIIPVMSGAEYSQSMALSLHELGNVDYIDPFPTRKQVWDGKILIASLGDIGPPTGTTVPCACRLALDGDPEVKGYDLLDELNAQIETVNAVLTSFETHDFPVFSPPPLPGPVRVREGIWMFPPSMAPDEVNYWLEENSRKGWLPT
jgi:hypothetical protein